ncbi:MAG: VaFE repeat-containing surface-anchored protein [Lachnospiraceae bacterium]|nr:VaFE repeat-containing surface-anchored protein [Lachnospiraceae bacterium]
MKNDLKHVRRKLTALMMAVAVILQTLTFSGIGSGNAYAMPVAAEEDGGLGWKVANAALKYLGYGYEMENKRDGSPESGYTFDCSGLIWTALKDAGITGISSAYPTQEVWSTADWNNAIGNHSLGLSYQGQPLTIRYADRLEDYRSLLKERDPKAVIIYTGMDADTQSVRSEDLLSTGDVIITRSDPMGNHAQIVLGTYPYSGSGRGGVMKYFSDCMSAIATAFPDTVNARMANAVPVLVDDDPAVYEKTGILSRMKPLERYSTVYSGLQKYSSGINSSWLAMLNLETLQGTVTPVSNPTWVVDDASKDSGVRITNRLMGKSNTSFFFLIHFPAAAECSAELRVVKLAEQKDGTYAPSSDAAFTMYSDAACTKDAVVLTRAAGDPEGEFTYVWKDKKAWSDYFHLGKDADVHAPQTVYLRETKAPAGHTLNTTVFKAVITPAKDKGKAGESSAVYYAGKTGASADTRLGGTLNATWQAMADASRLALAVRDPYLRVSGNMYCGVDKELANVDESITAQFLVSTRNADPAETAKEAVRIAALSWDNASTVNSPYRYSIEAGKAGAEVSGLIPGTWYYAKILKEAGVRNLATGAELKTDPSFYCAIMKITVSSEGKVTRETSYGKAETLQALSEGRWQDASSQTVTGENGLLTLKITNEINSSEIRFRTGVYKYGNETDDPLEADFAASAYSGTIREAVRSIREAPGTVTTGADGYSPEQLSNRHRIPAGETLTEYRIYHETGVKSKRDNVTFIPDEKYYLAEVSCSSDLYGKPGAQSTVWYVNNTLSETGWTKLSRAAGEEFLAAHLVPVGNRTETTAPVSTGIRKYGDNDKDHSLNAVFKVTGLAGALSSSVNNFSGTEGTGYNRIRTGSKGLWLYRTELKGLQAGRTTHRYKIFKEESVEASFGISYLPDPDYYLVDMYVTLDRKGNVTSTDVDYYRSETLGEAQKTLEGWQRIRDTSVQEGILCINVNNQPDLSQVLGFGVNKTDDIGQPVTATYAYAASEALPLSQTAGEDLFGGTDYSDLLDSRLAAGTAETFTVSDGKAHTETFRTEHVSGHTYRKIIVLREVQTEQNHLLDPSYYLIRCVSSTDPSDGSVVHRTEYYRSADGDSWTFVRSERWDAYNTYEDFRKANESAAHGVSMINERYGSASETVEGRKILVTGNNRTLTSGEFTFRITQTAAPSVDYSGHFADQTASCEADGSFHFEYPYTFLFDPARSVDMSGRWTFEITEVSGNAGPVSVETGGEKGEILYGGEVYELNFFVQASANGSVSVLRTLYKKTKENASAQGATVTDPSEVKEEAEEIVFKNYYRAEGSAELKIKKDFEKTLSGGEFLFDVICEDTTANDTRTKAEILALMSRKGLTNDENGVVRIPAFFFEKNTLEGTDLTGLYTFSVKERRGNVSFVSYDPAEYRFTVEVTDDEHGGLTTVIRDEKGAVLSDTDYVTRFKNGYLAEGRLVFDGKKELEGFDPADGMDAGKFSFILENTLWPEGAMQIPAQKVQNSEDGTFAFDEIIFRADSNDRSALGTYRFVISEEPGDAEGILYSAQKYVYEVTVRDEVNAYDDEAAGTLTVEKHLAEVTGLGGNDPKDPGREILLTDGSRVRLSPAAAKVLEDLRADEDFSEITEEWAEMVPDLALAFRKQTEENGVLMLRTDLILRDGSYRTIRTAADTEMGIVIPQEGVTLEKDLPLLSDKEISEKLEKYHTDSWFLNRRTELVIGKADALTGRLLSGAELTLTDSEGGEVARWKSSSNKAEVILGLPAGTYYLTETEAPEGYEIAPAFTVTMGNGITHVTVSDIRAVGIRTLATDDESGTHEQLAEKQAGVTDRVMLESLTVGVSYRIVGTLYDAKTGAPVTDHGKVITSEKTFTYPELSENGSAVRDGMSFHGIVEMPFSYDASDLGGRTVVIFEDLYQGDRKVASHADLESKEQSVTIIRSEKPTPVPSNTPTPSLTPVPSETPVPSLTPVPSETPVPSLTPEATPTVKAPTPSVTETPTPTVSVTPVPEISVTPVPSVSATPTPTIPVTPAAPPSQGPGKPPILGISPRNGIMAMGLFGLGTVLFGVFIFLIKRRP